MTDAGREPASERWTSAACAAAIIGCGPVAQPIFHPVKENVFPELEMLIVRSRIPGSEAIGTCSTPS